MNKILKTKLWLNEKLKYYIERCNQKPLKRMSRVSVQLTSLDVPNQVGDTYCVQNNIMINIIQ
jgi:hypothetical protein